jgi:hypothetical protein
MKEPKILNNVEALILRKKNVPLDWQNKGMWRQLDTRIGGLTPLMFNDPTQKFRIRPKEKV